jgi:hypothetical protein
MPLPRRRLWPRRALLLLLSALAGCALAEGGLRLLLFGDVPALASLARALRQPRLYADMRRDDLYWKLQRIWTPPAERPAFGELAPATGWTSAAIDRRTLLHADEAALGERRPVLLYGDSFAECVTPPEFTWQGLLERAPEGRTHALLNFGTSGFGMDQALTLLEATLPRFAARHPLVVFAVFLDEGPDRALLGFRGMPKPRCELVDGQLVFHPLEETDAQSWWEQHPPGVASYLWRMLWRRVGPAGDEQVMEIARAILARLHRELEAQGIEHFVLGFHSRAMLENPGELLWREQSIRAACAALGLRYLSARPYLLAAVDGQSERVGQSLFVTQGPDKGHYGARGNAAVFEAFLQALHGRYAPEDTSGVKAALLRLGLDPRAEQQRELLALGAPATLTFHGHGPARCLREVGLPDGSGTRMLGLRPELELPARLAWKLERPTRFVASLSALRSEDADESPESVRLRLQVDGQDVRTLELRPGEPAQALELELRAGCTFALAVEPVADGVRSCWARLEAPAFR